MEIEVSVPSLLMDCIGGTTSRSLKADTLQEAIDTLFSEYPLLRRHVYTEAGALRQHVLLYYNDQNIAWLERLDLPLRPGDRLLVLQAVSGG